MAVVSASKLFITLVNANFGIGKIVSICTPQHDARNRSNFVGGEGKDGQFIPTLQEGDLVSGGCYSLSPFAPTSGPVINRTAAGQDAS
jgi:hypothetical protein